MKGPKKTTFNSDECQSLLDAIDRILINHNSFLENYDFTDEERQVLAKLKKGGEFYIP